VSFPAVACLASLPFVFDFGELRSDDVGDLAKYALHRFLDEDEYRRSKYPRCFLFADDLLAPTPRRPGVESGDDPDEHVAARSQIDLEISEDAVVQFTWANGPEPVDRRHFVRAGRSRVGQGFKGFFDELHLVSVIPVQVVKVHSLVGGCMTVL